MLLGIYGRCILVLSCRWQLLLLFFLVCFVMCSQMLFNHFLLSLTRSSMYLSVNLGISEEIIIIFHELSARLFIQTALGERYNQQTFNNFKNMGKRPACRVPVFFQSIHTDFSRWNCYIWMENLGLEVTYKLP